MTPSLLSVDFEKGRNYILRNESHAAVKFFCTVVLPSTFIPVNIRVLQRSVPNNFLLGRANCGKDGGIPCVIVFGEMTVKLFYSMRRQGRNS